MTIDLKNSYSGEVAIFDGVHDPGEVLKQCILTSNGDRMVLTARDTESRRYRRIDTLIGVTGDRNADGSLTFSGQSEHLLTVIGVPKGEDSAARWVVTLKGCQTCG